MARYSSTDKCIRTLLFLLGLRNRRIREALAQHGFDAKELAHGWHLLSQMSAGEPDYGAAPSSSRILRELDAWENRWFPIIDVVLRTNFPDVRRVLFRNLSRTDGAAVAISVHTMLQRLETMGRPVADGGLGEEGRRARARLTSRGLRPNVIAQAEQLLAELRTVEAMAEEDEEDPVDREKAEEEMWSSYLEWSGIARSAIKDGRLLRTLGFRRGGRRKRREREEDDEGGTS